MATAQLEFYRDEAGDHRWRVVAANRKVLSCSSEGYRHQTDAEQAANETQKAIARSRTNARRRALRRAARSDA